MPKEIDPLTINEMIQKIPLKKGMVGGVKKKNKN
jgi:hypothetical protein